MMYQPRPRTERRHEGHNTTDRELLCSSEEWQDLLLAWRKKDRRSVSVKNQRQAWWGATTELTADRKKNRAAITLGRKTSVEPRPGRTHATAGANWVQAPGRSRPEKEPPRKIYQQHSGGWKSELGPVCCLSRNNEKSLCCCCALAQDLPSRENKNQIVVLFAVLTWESTKEKW
jgi:hypothetical protein